MDFNYIDSLGNSANVQYMADQHDKALQLTGRKAYVFLLDKEETELSNVYTEEKHGRIYLPHFEQKAIYKTNSFIAQLTAKNYTETEDNLSMDFDLSRMVHNIQVLKQNSVGKLVITNTSKVPLDISIDNKDLFVKKDIEVLYHKDLTSGKSQELIHAINEETSFIKTEYTGDNETMDFVERKSFRLLPRRSEEMSVSDSLYKNIGDVISSGSLILTDRMKLYQVTGAYPRDDSYGRYLTWNVSLELFNLAKADGLPSDYAELIKKNQYGLGKLNI